MKHRKYVVAAILVIGLFLITQVSAANNTVKLYLHKSPSVGTVNTKSTGGRILNTTTSWSASVQESASDVASGNYMTVLFYLYPVLAGELTLNGVPSVVIYFKANASVSDLTYITTINKVAAAGTTTQISTKSSASQSVGTSYGALTNTHSTVSTTVATGFTLELNITIGGSASNLTITLGYDTLTTNSRLQLVATDPLSISLSSDKTIYEWHDGATLTATVTDVWGGYDISSAPTISFSSPTGLTYTTTASSTGDAQYTNTYTYSISELKGVGGPGTWTATTSVSDRSGNSCTSSSYSFDLKQEGGTVPIGPSQPIGGGDNTLWIIIIAVAVIIAIGYAATRK